MENQLPPSRKDDFQIFDFLIGYVKHWHWFLVSVTLCCGVAYLRIKSTPKTYLSTATILIVEDDNTNLSAGFIERSQFKTNVNVNNEIDMFRSPQLIQEVVKRLNLNINYSVKEWLMYIDLYTQSPIVASFPDSYEQDGFSFQVELKPDSVVVLSNFAQWGNVFPQSIITKLNEPTPSPIGSIVISPSLYYTPGQYSKPIVVSKNNTKSVSGGFAGALDVSLMSKEKTIIVLKMVDVSYQRAEDFLNTLIVVYNENVLKEKNRTIEATLRQIDERLPIIEEELQLLDAMIATYKKTHRVTDTRDAASLYMKESSENTGRIIEINNQIAIARSIQSQINDNSRTAESLPIKVGLNEPTIEASIAEYNALLFKRNDLIASGGGRNPVIEDLNHNLNSLRRSILHNIDNLINSLRIRLSSLRSQENRLAANIASNPVQEKDLTTIERDQTIKAQLYLYMLQQREENEMARIVTASNSRIVSPPSGTGAPVKPSKMKIMLAALIIGMAIPFGVITGRNELLTTIRHQKDLAHQPIPLLGIIPHADNRETKKKLLFVNEHGRDPFNESFRIVRTNLNCSGLPDMKVILFTSMESGSGKTFMAVNVAMSLALAGKKVALLDLDLRTAALSKMIDYPELGISITLSKSFFDEQFYVEKDYFHPGFDIIPAGPVPINPSDLLMSECLKMLIDSLKTSYDYVLMDVPHVGQVADANIVGKFADLSIFVLRENHTDRRKLEELADIYHSGNFKDVRIILNASNHRSWRKEESLL